MPTAAILGAQWGDEGKGKLVDLLSRSADLVVRFQGGPNAGHTIDVVDGSKHTKLVLHHIPSGVLHEGTTAIMGEGMVIDPISLARELDQLADAGIDITPTRLRIGLDAHIILPLHRDLDRAREAARGDTKIGTTLRGMGPVYEDRSSRRGLRFRDLRNLEQAVAKLDRLLSERNALLRYYGAEPSDRDASIALLASWRESLSPFFAETTREIDGAIQAGKRVLFEGAQGAMLDLNFGTYPYVTSSHTVTGGICIGAGIPPSHIGPVLGVTKAYTTRVGAGPFPSELEDDRGRHLATCGHEFGATTGRPRRCGWLDLVALRYSHARCGFHSLALTKLDVLSGLDRVGLCVGYRTADGTEITDYPRDPTLLDRVDPIVEYLPGWPEQLTDCTDITSLPKAARTFMDRVSNYMDLSISVVSVGSQRRHSIIREEPLWR